MKTTSKLQIIKLCHSLARDILKIYMLLTHLLLVTQVTRKGIGSNRVEAARVGSLEIYSTIRICVQMVT